MVGSVTCGRLKCCVMWWVYTSQVKDGIGVVNLLFTDQYFTCSLHLQRFKSGMHVPRLVWRVSHFQPVGGAAAVMYVADIYKVTFTHNYQAALSLSDWFHLLRRAGW